MAGEIKNKASKNWVSKFVNHVKSKLQEDRDFWGPVFITLGVISLLNYPSLSLTSITGGINLFCGLVLIIIGFCLIFFSFKPWLRISFTVGVALLFAGFRIKSINQINGWVIIGLSIIFIVLGFIFYIKFYKSLSKK